MTETGGFGDWLRGELSERGWTQTAFAARLPVSRGVESKQSHVSKWLRNERRPSPHSCALIAKALDLPLHDVLVMAGHHELDMELSTQQETHPGNVRDRLISLIYKTPEERLQYLLPLVQMMYQESEQRQEPA
ncbi:MAG: helix-turn-helix domain-containing protein [Thermomicrobiales bacterium]|jgi:transcriptional regulator with XRE-family HTH domain